MKITFNSPLILSFSFISIIVYILTAYIGLFQDWFVLQPDMGNDGFLSYFRLISYAFGHINLSHLVGNLSIILLVGPLVEERYGELKLAVMIGATVISTAVLHMMFFETGLLGASGVAFMLIILTSMADIKNKEIPLTFILVVLIYFGGEIIGSFSSDNVSHFAHIIGGAFGALFGFILKVKSKQKVKSPLFDYNNESELK